jgi:ribonucleotide reductase beta subunit family protein with ferritin-like domain
LSEHIEISTYDLAEDIKEIAYKMVDLEDAFIDLCFKDGSIQGITAGETKQYIRYIANTRWTQLGFSGTLYSVDSNPLSWLDWVINGKEHTNFFEARPTDYSKASLTEGDETEGW